MDDDMDAFVREHVCPQCGVIGTNVACNHCDTYACARCRGTCCIKLPCVECRRRRNWALRCDSCGKNVCARCAPGTKKFLRRKLCRACCVYHAKPCLDLFRLVAKDLSVTVQRRIEGVT
jgi:hypothetical protein